jgi:hypothetical protein
MIKNPKFDDIRPYYEEEIPAAMQRIADSDVFPLLASFVYPTEPLEEVRNHVRSFKTVREFQHDAMRRVNEQVIARSISEFTASGLERLSPDKQYLFVSNHRDIMLDACLLQYYLVLNGFETTEITFGANLMIHPVVIDVGKSNKMFKVTRPGRSAREFYKESLLLSQYIRSTITEKHQSVWIAQRNGRTKDGRDATDPAVIKMLGMSRRDDRVASLAELHIVPVSVSYEWESCDILKTKELYISRNQKYEKKPGEDLNSILTGVMQPKGKVTIHFGKVLSEAVFEELKDCPSGVFYKKVAEKMDAQIIGNYALFANNYIAHDLRSGSTNFAEHYTAEQKADFENHLHWMDNYPDLVRKLLEDIFLGIYANPIDSLLKLLKPSQG